MTCRDICDTCANDVRCWTCGDRMCETVGPGPQLCGTVCDECPPCDCTTCRSDRDDQRAETERLHQRDAQ